MRRLIYSFTTTSSTLMSTRAFTTTLVLMTVEVGDFMGNSGVMLQSYQAPIHFPISPYLFSPLSDYDLIPYSYALISLPLISDSQQIMSNTWSIPSTHISTYDSSLASSVPSLYFGICPTHLFLRLYPQNSSWLCSTNLRTHLRLIILSSELTLALSYCLRSSLSLVLFQI